MPSPVALVELPELDEEYRRAEKVWLNNNRGSLSGWSRLTESEETRLRMYCRERQLLDAITQLSALREASEWVSVTHRLPASGEKIWVARIIKATESIPAHYVVRDATYNPVHAFPYSGDGTSVHFWMPRQDPPLPPQPASAGKDK